MKAEHTIEKPARAGEGVIHTAYNHEYSQFAADGETARRAVEVLGTALKGTGSPLVITSAIGLLSPGRPTTEDDAGDPNGPGAVRICAGQSTANLKYNDTLFSLGGDARRAVDKDAG
jgi:hypothetical protein